MMNVFRSVFPRIDSKSLHYLQAVPIRHNNSFKVCCPLQRLDEALQGFCVFTVIVFVSFPWLSHSHSLSTLLPAVVELRDGSDHSLRGSFKPTAAPGAAEWRDLGPEMSLLLFSVLLNALGCLQSKAVKGRMFDVF